MIAMIEGLQSLQLERDFFHILEDHELCMVQRAHRELMTSTCKHVTEYLLHLATGRTYYTMELQLP